MRIMVFVLAALVVSNAHAWKTSTSSDPITDRKIVSVSQFASSGSNKFGRAPSLVLRCDGGKLSLYVDWGTFINNKSHTVIYRVDKNKAISEKSRISNDKTATFASSPVPIVQQMKPGSKLIVRTTPYSESTITGVFNLSGFTAAITPIEEQCSGAFLAYERYASEQKEREDRLLRQSLSGDIGVNEWGNIAYKLCKESGKSCYSDILKCQKQNPEISSAFKACITSVRPDIQFPERGR